MATRPHFSPMDWTLRLVVRRPPPMHAHRKGSGQGLLEAGKGFHGESTYRSAHSQPELIRQAMTWNKRAEVHR